ncbi:MAG: phosphoglycerate dehydrogenase [Acidobacteriota bacterium]|nr:MAG: phosphoglycerate dehydrogenase [Acidobacteriota bacterium]
MKILISDNLSPSGIELLRGYEQFEVDVRVGLKPEELKKIIGEYDALIVRSETKVTADILSAADRLRVIGRAGTGVDNIDVPAATQKGIVVMNAAAGNSVTTAEHTISLMMSLARKIPQAHGKLKAGTWDKKSFMGTELAGKTLGVIGLGNIGKIVASRAIGLAMKVLAYDPFITREVAAKAGIELGSLDDIFQRADFITVHTPLTEETRGIIGEAAFAKMKDGVRIINCARGGLVDEDALYNAIKSGKVKGAALDVFVKEPVPVDHPLLKLDEVVVTPHLGASTSEAQDSVAVTIAEQVANFLANGAIAGAVNIPAVSPETLETLRPYLTLGRKLGSFLAQYFNQPVSEVQIRYSGEVAAYDVRPITQAVLTGLLSSVSARVNQVNASLIAEERGLRVTESKDLSAQDFTSLIEVAVRNETNQSRAAGSIFGPTDLRIVGIDSYRLEAQPEGHMLVILNDDQPGVVGRIGTFLGSREVNIAQLYLSRNRAGGTALSVYQVDSALDARTLAELATVEHVLSVRQIGL